MLESKGFKLSKSKTEYMECKVSSTRQRSNKLVTIVNEDVTKTKKFASWVRLYIIMDK